MYKSRIFVIYFLIIFWQCFLFNNKSYGSGVMLDSMGPVSSGRGGTNIAHSDNGVLIHDNPAALVNMATGKTANFGLGFAYPDIKYRDPQGSDYSKHEIITLPTFSLIYKKEDNSRFAFGIGGYIPAGFKTEYHLDHKTKIDLPILRNIPVSFGDQLYRTETSFMKLLFSTSYKVNDKLSLGFSFGPALHRAEIEAPFTQQTGPAAGKLSFLADISTKDNFGYSYVFGAQYKLGEKTVLGISYISESRATLRGDADIIIPKSAPGGRLLLTPFAEYDIKANFEWPRSVGIGIAQELGMSHRLSLDVLWIDWASAFDRLDFELTDGDNRLFNSLLGNTVNDAIPLDWNGSFSFRFGYEYFHKGNRDNVLRFGYLYDDNPIPGSTLVPIIPGIIKHIFSIGYSHKLRNKWDKWTTHMAVKLDISDDEKVGKSKLVGDDFSNSSLKAKGYFFFMGMDYNF